jgi:hypothetical protein
MLRFFVPKNCRRVENLSAAGAEGPRCGTLSMVVLKVVALSMAMRREFHRGNTRPFESRGHLGNFHSWQLQPGPEYDPSVEQIDAAFGVPSETRIVRCHTDG